MTNPSISSVRLIVFNPFGVICSCPLSLCYLRRPPPERPPPPLDPILDDPRELLARAELPLPPPKAPPPSWTSGHCGCPLYPHRPLRHDCRRDPCFRPMANCRDCRRRSSDLSRRWPPRLPPRSMFPAEPPRLPSRIPAGTVATCCSAELIGRVTVAVGCAAAVLRIVLPVATCRR